MPTASSARGRRRRFLQMGIPTIIYVAKVKKKRTKVVSEGIEKVAKNNSKPKGRKRDPKHAGDPKGSQKEAKGVKREAKRSQREVKVSQREPKGSQRATNMHPKIGLGARADFWSKKGEPRIYFWSPFWIIFRAKSQQKIDAKTDVEKT